MGGLGPLTWSVFDRWAERMGLSTEKFEMFWPFIRALDDEYLSWISAEMKKESRDADET